MKYSWFVFIVLVILSCSKTSTTKQNTNPPYTPTPGPTPINTSLMVYAINNNQNSNPLSLSANNVSYNYLSNYGGFQLNNVTTDKYSSQLEGFPRLSYDCFSSNKTFTVTSSVKNYISLNVLVPIKMATVYYDDGSGTFNLQNSGQLILPSYSFGHHSGSTSFDVRTSYITPSINNYAVSLPCYAMADENGKRFFLDSYGIYVLVPEASDNSGCDIDFDPAANVILKLPIPATLINAAPDSIAVWDLISNLWRSRGYARKVNGYYEKKIDHKGFWNFAIPRDGAYLTLHLNAAGGFGLANTRFIVKSNGDEIADGRTDAEGNALIFVPINRALSLTIINDNFSLTSTALADQNLGVITTATEKEFTIPERIDLMTLEGNVFNCDGTPFSNGTALLAINYAKDVYSFPIQNGHFKAAQWVLSSKGYLMGNLNIVNASGSSVITYPVVLGSVNGIVKKYNINFYTCSNSDQLFCNYRLDTTNYKVTGNIHSSSPTLMISRTDAVNYKINVNNNGAGLNFDIWFSASGDAYLGGSRIEVNGTPVQYDYTNGQSEIYVTRNDSTTGGFFEGWFFIYYKDVNNLRHTITGNFRIKKA